MRNRMGVLVFAAVFVLYAVQVSAEPKNGFGLNGGIASHSMKGEFDTGGKFSYKSSGLSIGIDYQFAVSDVISINPFLMSSAESAEGDVPNDTQAGHGILGIQVRYWFSDVFLGAHVARYTEVLDSGAGNTNAAGNGIGLVVGWEKPDGGLFLMGQIDAAKIHYSDADVDLGGLRLSVGYRWK